MRLPVDIFKHRNSDCSNGGVSSKHNEAILIWGESAREIIDNPPQNKCVLLLIPGNGNRQYKIIPFNTLGWPMFGGCFVYSSDSRFPADYPIALHDRYE